MDFLSFHHLFGPWAIIISSLMIDLGKFLTILMLFEFGFSMLVMAMNQPYTAPTEMSQSVENTVELLKSHGGSLLGFSPFLSTSHSVFFFFDRI